MKLPAELPAVPVAIVTGSGGLIGSEAVTHFVRAGFEVIGIESDSRASFFGPDASTQSNTERLKAAFPTEFRSEGLDIRDRDGIDGCIARHAAELELVVHTAAQPSHDWAVTDPHTDFSINAVRTMNLLEGLRRHNADATFIFASTNKVYGDRPNFLPLEDHGNRLDLAKDHPFYNGIDTSMSIDGCLHSLFGVSKASADLMVQEYGRYFGMPTVCFRAGCLTGPNHTGAQLHGFLSYLMRCTVTGTPYTVFGYDGKQVRDNIHSNDVVRAMGAFHQAPRSGAVYNLGGERRCSCSMREAITASERVAETPWNGGATNPASATIPGGSRILPPSSQTTRVGVWLTTESTLREIHDRKCGGVDGCGRVSRLRFPTHMTHRHHA